MRFGTFNNPSHPAGRDIREGFLHNLDYLQYLDRIGAYEAWVGSHYTVALEPQSPNDMLIAAAIPLTNRIKLNPGAYIAPLFHPAELAHRIAWLDHISKGRVIAGLGASGVPTDLDMFGIDFRTNQNREMLEESVEMIIKLWASTEPMEIKGKYWTIRHPKPMIDGNLRYHMRPFQKPRTPLAITGFSAGSPTLRLAGKLGLIPCSFSFGKAYLRSHWDSVVRGADEAQRDPPPKSEWRVVREVMVAETDAKARDLALNGPMGSHYRAFFLPMLEEAGMLKSLKHHPDVPDSDVTVEYLIEHCWSVGSEETVLNQLGEIYDIAGGFGVLVAMSYDHLDYFDEWRWSIDTLCNSILPKIGADARAEIQPAAE
jgi:alkanesulfonate monooxygenase SsuD/methylene tetrahydromethanopterin reductase-like flavin-dependent oxidoreductase (luciferase family)